MRDFAPYRDLVARLRSDPNDHEAFVALRDHYTEHNNTMALVGLYEECAARWSDGVAAADVFFLAGELAWTSLRDRARAASCYERALARYAFHVRSAVRLEELVEASGDQARLGELFERRALMLASMALEPRELAALHYELGQKWAIKLKITDRALFHYRRAFELDPDMVPAIYAAREIYKRSGNVRSAVSLCELEVKAETDKARKVSLLRELAAARRNELDDLEGCIVALKRAKGLAPEDWSVLHDLAQALLARAERATSSDVSQIDRRRAADLYCQMAASVSASEALPFLEAALHTVPSHTQALDNLESVAQSLGMGHVMPEYWVAYLEAVPKGASTIEVRRKLGRVYLQVGQIADAVSCFSELLAYDDIEAGQVLVDLFERLGQTQQSLDTITWLLARLPASERGAFLRRSMRMFQEIGATGQAAARARDLLEIEPYDVECLLYLEKMYRSGEEHVRLRDILMRSARISSQSVESRKTKLKEVAWLSEVKLGDLEGAVSNWRALLSLDPTDVLIRDSFRKLLERHERWDDVVSLMEREARAAQDRLYKAEVYRNLARIHSDKRQDWHETVQCYKRLRELTPEDTDARDALCDALLMIENYVEAVPLLKLRIDALDQGEAQINALRLLATVLEEKIGDDAGAFDAAMRLVHLSPWDAFAMAVVERTCLRLKWHERLIAASLYRAEKAPVEERVGLLIRAAQISSHDLGEWERAAQYLAQALQYKPNDEGVFLALCDAYERCGRYRDLVMILREQVNATLNTEIKKSLYRKLAQVLAVNVRNPSASAEVWLKVLAFGEDEEALYALARIYRKIDKAEQLEPILLRLAAIEKDAAEAMVLKLERAVVLARRLDRIEEARELLKTLQDTEFEHYKEVLIELIYVYRALNQDAALFEILEVHFLQLKSDEERLETCKEMVDLADQKLHLIDKSVIYLMQWCDLDASAIEPRLRVLPMLRETSRWIDVREVLDSLSLLEHDEDNSARLVRESAEVCIEHLNDIDGAWARLLDRVDNGDGIAEGMLLTLAQRSGRTRELADYYASAADSQANQPDIYRLWMKASRIYCDDVGDAALALHTSLRAFYAAPENTEVLNWVFLRSVSSKDWDALASVVSYLSARLEKIEQRVALMLRHCRTLFGDTQDADKAFDIVLRACALMPLHDEALELAEQLATKTTRASDLLVVYERRRSLSPSIEASLEMWLRSIHLSEVLLQDRQRAIRYIAQAVRDLQDHSSLLDAVERLCGQLDQTSGASSEQSLTYTLAKLYGQMAQDNIDRERCLQLLERKATLLVVAMGDYLGAFDALRQATALAPENEKLCGQLERIAEQAGLSESLDAHWNDLIADAIDAKTAILILRRRGLLLMHKIKHFGVAAEVYRRILEFDPTNQEAGDALIVCLEQEQNHQELLVAIDRQLAVVYEPSGKANLLRKLAVLWENSLGNAWEALDAWQQLLLVDAGDLQAQEALARLSYLGRPKTRVEISRPESLSHPSLPTDTLRPSSPVKHTGMISYAPTKTRIDGTEELILDSITKPHSAPPPFRKRQDSTEEIQLEHVTAAPLSHPPTSMPPPIPRRNSA